MLNKTDEQWCRFDRDHLWHPYAAMQNAAPVYAVASAQGVRIKLADGRELIDGMASWWCAIHGYGHPLLNQAISQQLEHMAHVMFGGLTHRPAVDLAARLIALTPAPLQQVFFVDSGSVAVEVALKMALQYWHARGQAQKHRLLTIKHGYHGDTFGAMSVCDPVAGMHQRFAGQLPKHLFAAAPESRFEGPWQPTDIAGFSSLLEQHHPEIAAVILEPIVQGAGGMRIYHPEYLRQVRELTRRYNTLLILDEIATGFGRTGKFFACQHSGVEADIMCVGKALTGGYLSLAATLCTHEISATISNDGAGVLMHGPTFMANPLACRVALASIDLLLAGPWQQRVAAIESQLQKQLLPLAQRSAVKDVRVLGAIGVLELDHVVDVAAVQAFFVRQGVWIRPFRNLIYIMPAYIINADDLQRLTCAMGEAVAIA